MLLDLQQLKTHKAHNLNIICLCVCVRFIVQLYMTVCNSMDCSQPGSFCPWGSPGRNTVVVSHALLQGILPNQGSKSALPHYRQLLCRLSHQGSIICLGIVFLAFILLGVLWASHIFSLICDTNLGIFSVIITPSIFFPLFCYW